MTIVLMMSNTMLSELWEHGITKWWLVAMKGNYAEHLPCPEP
jgi:Flp pilus assembly protein TadB